MAALSELAELHPRPFPRGAHCNAEGAFVENVPLLRTVLDPFGRPVRVPRRTNALNLDLSSGYCLEVDASGLTDELIVIARALNKGDIVLASRRLAALRLPPFPVRLNGRLRVSGQYFLAQALRAILLLKETDERFNKNSDFEAEHPRQPKGSPDGIGGEFAPKAETAPATAAKHDANKLSLPVRIALKALVSYAKKSGWELLFPEEITLEVLSQLLQPVELNQGEEEALARMRAEYDFAGGKSLEEIRSHRGGPGYQNHHFLENTKENQAHLLSGERDAPENMGNIPSISHEELHAEMSTKPTSDGGTLRDSLRADLESC